ncbi:MAG: UDP-N-acetylmuramate--L-alanine ligase [Bacteroidales bacterium]|nr:UDP-N-acetylmuramate--L-alanine ligase [Bacteroidales bacterium]
MSKTYYLLGIGGIGMSAIAEFLLLEGHEVYGFDAACTPLTEKLQQMGAKIHYEPDPESIPQNIDVVIFTPAIPDDFEEWTTIKKLQIPILKRIDFIGQLVADIPVIAVAGTHGKTTVSALIAHTLKQVRIPQLSFIGGIVKKYDTNLFYDKMPQWAVVEADEYDRSFLKLSPRHAIINAIEADHLDVYENEEKLFSAFSTFINKTHPQGEVCISHDVRLNKLDVSRSFCTYGIEQGHVQARNISINNGKTEFDVYMNEQPFIKSIQLPFPGTYQIKNALAATIMLSKIGLSASQIKNGIETFPGIKRRFDIIIETEHVVYIDDYAHHPTEIKSLIEAIRTSYPRKYIKGIFQPHLYSRTRDLAQDFAAVLDLIDEPLITDIYPAREKPIPGIDHEFLLSLMKNPLKRYVPYGSIPQEARNISGILLTIGAGNVDLLIPDIVKKIIEK